MTYQPTLEHARHRDEADPLRAFRERFALLRDERGQPTLFLCGHSLGLMPLAARKLVTEELDDWSQLAVLGHEHARRPWIPYHENLTAGLGHLTGARASEVIAMNSLTVNLHLMLVSFYRPTSQRYKILMEGSAFPSDQYAIESQVKFHDFQPSEAIIEIRPRAGECTLRTEDILQTITENRDSLALVMMAQPMAMAA